jgi:hypothetical protein
MKISNHKKNESNNLSRNNSILKSIIYYIKNIALKFYNY